MVDGLTVTPVKVAALPLGELAVIVTVALWLVLLYVAVTVTVVAVVVLDGIVKLPLFSPAPIVKLAGI